MHFFLSKFDLRICKYFIKLSKSASFEDCKWSTGLKYSQKQPAMLRYNKVLYHNAQQHGSVLYIKLKNSTVQYISQKSISVQYIAL